MTNRERYQKLNQAMSLIRDVEFSYEHGDKTRQLIYKEIVNVFGLSGTLSHLMSELSTASEKESSNEID